jgi:hypothetical protein
MEKKQSLLQFTMTYGAILGVISIILSLTMYLTGYMPVNFKRIFLMFLITMTLLIVFISTGMKNYRDKVLGGSITFSQALIVGILIMVFSTVLSGFYNLIFNNYIDPDYSGKLIESQQKWNYDFMNKMGATNAQIEEQMDRFDKLKQDVDPLQAFFQSIYMSAIIGTIISLIIAAFTKKNQNPVANN